MAKTEHAVVTQTDKPAKAGTPSANKVSGSSASDWRDGDTSPQYNKKLRGFTGVDRGPKTAGKQIQGYDGPGKPNSASSREHVSNASIDKSPYQLLVKSMSEGKLR